MNLTYQLDQNDFLQYQLYVASKTPRIKKQRTRSWLIVTGAFLFISFVVNESGNSRLSLYFLVTAMVTLIFYPLYQRHHYRKHYAKFIGDTYKNRFGQTANISFTENAMESHDDSGESKINLKEIENITETGEYFYVKLRSGGHFIIPKRKVGNVAELQNELRQLCGRLNIGYIDDLTWRWK